MKSINLVLVGTLLVGCSHTLEVKNIAEYKSDSLVQKINKPISIGLVFNEGNDTDLRQMVKEIGSELQKYSTEVIYPFNSNGYKKVDVEARVSIESEYKGSGANFWINWPGFLVFAPAWNGYVYKINYDVNVVLFDTAKNKMIDKFSLPINLDIRHASINRTWTELSWLEVSAIAFIGGLAFTQYSPSVTPLVVHSTSRTLGNYIAEEIVNHLNASGLYSQIFVREITEWLASR
ncbi:MAG: hypothetical protein IPN90_02515 [Elusimicrobia bacterium]|nr:hypothetical protein [Elusimicrobiota bacterium]